jgi:hypothetical protein
MAATSAARRAGQVGKHRVERVELVEVSVPADRRAGSAVASTIPIVATLQRSRRQIVAGQAFGQARGFRRQVVQQPMHPGALRRRGIGRIRIIMINT